MRRYVRAFGRQATCWYLFQEPPLLCYNMSSKQQQQQQAALCRCPARCASPPLSRCPHSPVLVPAGRRLAAHRPPPPAAPCCTAQPALLMSLYATGQASWMHSTGTSTRGGGTPPLSSSAIYSRSCRSTSSSSSAATTNDNCGYIDIDHKAWTPTGTSSPTTRQQPRSPSMLPLVSLSGLGALSSWSCSRCRQARRTRRTATRKLRNPPSEQPVHHPPKNYDSFPPWEIKHESLGAFCSTARQPDKIASKQRISGTNVPGMADARVSELAIPSAAAHAVWFISIFYRAPWVGRFASWHPEVCQLGSVRRGAAAAAVVGLVCPGTRGDLPMARWRAAGRRRQRQCQAASGLCSPCPALPTSMAPAHRCPWGVWAQRLGLGPADDARARDRGTADLGAQAWSSSGVSSAQQQ